MDILGTLKLIFFASLWVVGIIFLWKLIITIIKTKIDDEDSE